MKKKSTQIGFLLFLLFSLSFCADDSSTNPNQTASASSKIKPIANAGLDVIITLPINSTPLNGSLSASSDGVVEKFQWSKLSGPNSFTITDPDKAITNVTDLVAGIYTFRLTVTTHRNFKDFDEVVVTVNKGTVVTSPPTMDELYFSGNMDNVTITTSNNKLQFNGWDNLKTNEHVGSFNINNIGGIPYAYQEIAEDPINPSKNALYAKIIDDDPLESGTTRAQITMGFKDGVNLSIYHTSHRLYLNPDIGHLQNYSSAITWFTIFEIWNARVAEWSGDIAGSARWSFSIKKESGVYQPLYWEISSQYMQPLNVKFNDIWRYTNKQTAIPLGKWFTLDLYMKRGEGSNGKMIIKITPDGEQTNVLFDITNTTIYPGHPEINLYSWQPFKLYLNDVYLDWMRDNNKTISAYYNDFKWYKN